MNAALAEATRAMRALGFFRGLDEADALAAVDAKVREEWGAAEDVPERVADLVALAADEESAWWHDAECDCLEGNRTYVEWATGLAAASRGTLRLDAVEEEWLPGPPGAARVRVTLRAGRRRQVVMARDFGDYVDSARLAEGLNALLPRGGARYRRVETGDQMVFLVFADDAQVRGLEARGWRFPSPRPTPKAGGLRGAVARWWDAFTWPFRA